MIKVSAENFGPIVKGEVDLKPLTIFVGPSNAGKSYMAMLIYSLMQSLEVRPYGRFYPGVYARAAGMGRRRISLNFDEIPEITEEIHKAIDDWAHQLEPTDNDSVEAAFDELPTEVQRLIGRIVQGNLDSIQELFSSELQRCHGNIADLRSRRSGAGSIKVGLEQSQPHLRLNFEENEDSIHAFPKAKWEVPQMVFEIPDFLVRWPRTEPARGSGTRREIWEFHHRELLEFLSESTLDFLFEGFPRSFYYLPAARSGIAQGHKAIASILVRQSSFAAIRPLAIPTLSGVITDFMGHILTMEQAQPSYLRRSSRELKAVVDFLEREVVGGKISIESSKEITYPEISYIPIDVHRNKGKFPFHRTSSMVSELAPVVLFLKHLVQPGDLVILEEPESHLHPASQRQMARGIVRLVNAGIKVIITTHSDFFVAQINNLLKLSHASRQKREKEGYEAEDCLRPEDLSAFYFRLDAELGGSVIEELEVPAARIRH